MYGAIAPALPPSSSAGSLRRNPTMMTTTTTTANGGGNLNRADSMASSARGGGGGGMSDSGHSQQYQGFYPGLPPPMPSQPQLGQVYGGAYQQQQHDYQDYAAPQHHQGYAPQYQQGHSGGLDYSNSMRRPGGGGYEY